MVGVSTINLRQRHLRRSQSRRSEVFDLPGAEGPIQPRRTLELVVKKGPAERRVPVTLRVDTPIEVEYIAAGGILPFVLRQTLRAQA